MEEKKYWRTFLGNICHEVETLSGQCRSLPPDVALELLPPRDLLAETRDALNKLLAVQARAMSEASTEKKISLHEVRAKEVGNLVDRALS